MSHKIVIIQNQMPPKQTNGAIVIDKTGTLKPISLKEYNKEQPQPRIKILLADDYLTQHPGDFWFDIKTTGLERV